jgi:hypothetical protein
VINRKDRKFDATFMGTVKSRSSQNSVKEASIDNVRDSTEILSRQREYDLIRNTSYKKAAVLTSISSMGEKEDDEAGDQSSSSLRVSMTFHMNKLCIKLLD